MDPSLLGHLGRHTPSFRRGFLTGSLARARAQDDDKAGLEGVTKEAPAEVREKTVILLWCGFRLPMREDSTVDMLRLQFSIGSLY